MQVFHRKGFQLAVAVAVSALVGSAAQAATLTTVMSGLNSPRGIAFGPQGAIYVAEAGSGGPLSVDVNGTTFNYGFTGSVSRLWKGKQERVVTGLPSVFNGMSILGAHDVAFNGLGNGMVSIGLGADPVYRSQMQNGHLFGSIIGFKPNGKWSLLADVSGYEGTINPDGSHIDSNPYGLLANKGKVYVTDAGGNSVLSLAPNGNLTDIAVLPGTPLTQPFPIVMDAVPTTVALGPDGAIYFGQLTGFPFPGGGAKIYRVVPGEAPTVYAEGFTTIIDMAFAPDGSLYVVEYFPGNLVKVETDGTKSVVLSGLSDITSVAVNDEGTVYLASGANRVGDGVVLRVDF